MDDTTFLVTWDDTSNVGVVNLTKVELEEFATRTGSNKGENIALMLQTPFFIGITPAIRGQTRNTNENGRPYVQTDTEV